MDYKYLHIFTNTELGFYTIINSIEFVGYQTEILRW